MRVLALTCALAALLVGGCGGSDRGEERPAAPSGDLVVASALPLQGPGAARARDIVDGERLALSEASNRAGRFDVELRSLDDAAPEGGWQPGPTVDAARDAVADPATIAYLGDFDAGATALSLPITNEAQLLQVTPGATYDGFTGGPGATPGEPEKYEPSGVRTFGRIPPADSVQAQAIADRLAAAGCRRLAVLSAPSAFDASLAELVADTAERHGIRVVHSDQVRPDPESHADAALDVVEAGARCATFAGGPGDLPGAVLQALHDADGGLDLVVGMALADDDVARSLGDAAHVTEIVGPPAPDERFAAAFARAHGRQPGPWAAYGREAMRRVLSAIEVLGEDGNDRAAVARAYLARYEPTDELALWRATPDGLEHVAALPAT